MEKQNMLDFLGVLEEFTGYKVSDRAADLAWEKYSRVGPLVISRVSDDDIETIVAQPSEADLKAAEDIELII